MAPRRRALGLACLSACGLALLATAGAAGSAHRQRVRRTAHVQQPLRRATWLTAVRVTEYYPVPERWFVGQRVAVPGLGETHRVDWLYSARGVSMEGDGIDLAGRQVHIAALGSGGWINAAGQRTSPGGGGWSAGNPFWRAGAYWATSAGRPTFPLEAGGWANGPGVRYLPLPGVTFAPGPSRALRYYGSIAVDPRLIPLGSRVYIPAYHSVGASHGWFVAQDTGGGIVGAHVDVYRPPPSSPSDFGQSLAGQRVYVIPPSAKRPPPGSAPGTPAAPAPASPPSDPATGGNPAAGSPSGGTGTSGGASGSS